MALITNAWDSDPLSSDEAAWLAADFPLLAAQAIPVSPDYAKWVDDAQELAGGDLASWTDRSATVNPARYAYDGLISCVTKPGVAPADDIWYYSLDLGGLVDFDCAFLIGHNAGTISVENDVILEIADNNQFDVDLQTVGNFGTPTDDNRLVDLDLNHGGDPQRYSAQFVRVKFDGPGNIIPEIRELILGRRYQPKTNPTNSWDKDGSLHDEIARTRTAGGVTHTTVYHENRHTLVATFQAWETARIEDFKAWFKASRGSFIWTAEPSSAPEEWRMITKPPDLDMPSAEFTERTVRIFGEEQGPEEYFLENET